MNCFFLLYIDEYSIIGISWFFRNKKYYFIFDYYVMFLFEFVDIIII